MIAIDRITVIALLVSAPIGVVASLRWRWMRFTVVAFVIAALAVVDGWRGDWLAAGVAALIVAVCVFRDLRKAKLHVARESAGAAGAAKWTFSPVSATLASVSTSTPKLILGDRYDVLAPVGAGSAATVFRVRDRRTGALRAAKVLKPENAIVPDILARFEDEYRILRTLHHPHLPEVHDYGWTADGGRFLVMELVDGAPLDAYFRGRPGDIWVILYELCEILTFIHSHNLLHQDIKPTNILVSRTTAFGDERPLVKLIDFGLTYRRDAGAAVQLVGTAAYVAPEVVRGEAPLTRAVDYYSLGVTLYELLCGTTPFHGTENEVLRAHIERTPLIEREKLEWAELYPHVRALLEKDTKSRLGAFEELRRAVASRLTGGIAELDRAYGQARIESLGMIGKAEAWRKLMAMTLPAHDETGRSRVASHAIAIVGQPASGRGHFLEAARSEWRIRGIPSWKLGDNSEAEPLLRLDVGESLATATEKDFENAWVQLEDCARKSVVWIVASGSLSVDEERLLHYLETRRTLSEFAVRQNVGFVFTVDDRSKQTFSVSGDETREIVIPSLTADDIQSVADRFRGEVFGTADAQFLRGVLEDARGSADFVSMLRRLSAGGGLLFAAQRWQIDRDPARILATVPVPAQATLRLTPDQEVLMGWAACHPAPVPMAWLGEALSWRADKLSDVVDELRYHHVVEVVDQSGLDAVRIVARSVVASAYASLGDELRRLRHEWYATRLLGEIQGSKCSAVMAELRHLSHHQQCAGADREAYRTRRRIFREWRRCREYGEIERVCRESLNRGLNLSPAIARAYLADLVDCLWARNLTTHAYKAMRDYSSAQGAVPNGLLPRYARGLSDALGPQQGLEFLQTALRRARRVSGVLVCRLQIELALCYYNLSQYESGLGAAISAEETGCRLSPRDRARLEIYKGIIYGGLGQSEDENRCLSVGGRLAREHGAEDELMLLEVLAARRSINEGRPDEAIRIAMRAWPIAFREKLVLRQFQLMGHVATAYSSMGDNRRAVRWREKTVRLSEYLGQHAMLAGSWWRLATYEQATGKLGNALRYFDRAVKALDSSSRTTDRAYAHALRHDLHAYLRTDRVAALAKEADQAVGLTSDIGEQGTFSVYRAESLLRDGRLADASRAFVDAREKCLTGGRVDDAFRAEVGRARTLLALGDLTASRRELKIAEAEGAKVWYADATAQVRLVELLLLQRERRRDRRELTKLVARCVSVVECAHLETRLDLRIAMFRAFARMGHFRAARAAFAAYECEVRDVVANLEMGDLATRFLQRIDFVAHAGEFDLFEKRSARAVSVSAGA